MAQPLRMMMFAPRLPACESLHFARRLARYGCKWAAGSSGRFHACTRVSDPVTGRISIPVDAITLPEIPAGHEQTGSASLADFAALTRPGASPFDALLVPHAWLALPLGGPDAQPPAPAVVRVPHFAYLESDYGLISDNARKDLDKLLAAGSAFVFPSAWLRDLAVSQHAFPADRCHVILPASGYDGRPLDTRAVRRRYDLPDRFLLAPPLTKRGYDGRAVLDAAAALRDRFGLALPIVTLGPVLDECSGNPLAGTWEGRAFHDHLATTRLRHQYRPLGNVPADDWYALVAAASCVVVLSDDLPEVPTLALDALAVGTPLVYRESAVFRETIAQGGIVVTSRDQASTVAKAIRGAGEAPRPGPVVTKTADDEAEAYLRLAESLTRSRWHSRPRRAVRPTAGRDSRVAWLINHITLRAFEVPLIRSLGLEVYSSKVIPNHSDFMSGSADYSDDEYSTLPGWALDVLNRHNFYEQGATPQVLEVLNGFFGTIVSNYFGPNLASLVKGYQGRLVVRVFGREQPNNYTGYMDVTCGEGFWDNVWRMGERFWLGACYETIPEIEGQLLQKRALYLPLGLPDASFRRGQTWRGTKRQILFVCPRINILPPYYTRIYQAFKASFGDLPHVIAGRQPTPVADDHVAGALAEDAYRRLFDESRVMFYHSREPRHLHYHPLEAVASGLPLVYMRGGVLEQYGGPRQPGACETYPEARRKLERLLDGDEALTASILAAQGVLLKRFRETYNRRKWEDHFLGRVLATAVVPDTYTSLTTGQLSIATDREPAQPTRSLSVWADLPATNDPAFRDNDDLVKSLIAEGGESVRVTRWEAPVVPVAPRPRGIVAGLEKAAFKSRSRAVRGVARAALVAAYYTRAAVRQRVLRPSCPEVIDALPYRIARLVGADVSKRLQAVQSPVSRDRSLESPQGVPLPVPASALTVEELGRLCETHEAVLITHPYRRLNPTLPLGAVAEMPVAVVVSDVAHEFNSAWGEETAAVRREMVLWMRLARVVICGSEFLRQEVLRRYAVEPGKVRLIARALHGETEIGADEVRRAREEHGVPEHYLIAPGDLDPQRNHLTVLRALVSLRRQGLVTPPLVFPGRFLCGPESAYAREWERCLQTTGLRPGEDYLLLRGVSEEEGAALIGGAMACLTVSSWQAEADRATLRAMYHGVPVIASRLPGLTERLGDDALYVAPDDHDAVADAIMECLANPEAAQARARSAAETVRGWTWQQAARRYAEALQLAAQSGVEKERIEAAA